MPNNPAQVGINALPIPGKRDAPRTFKGNYDKVEEFLKTVDKLYARCQITLDDEKVEAVLQYCSTKVQDFVRTSPSFTSPDWNALKEHMMGYYDAERANRKYTPNDIWNFNKSWNYKSITNLAQWKRYYQEFFSKAGALRSRGEITPNDFKTLFWLGLPESIRSIFEPKIQAKLEDYDASVPYDILSSTSQMRTVTQSPMKVTLTLIQTTTARRGESTRRRRGQCSLGSLLKQRSPLSNTKDLNRKLKE